MYPKLQKVIPTPIKVHTRKFRSIQSILFCVSGFYGVCSGWSALLSSHDFYESPMPSL